MFFRLFQKFLAARQYSYIGHRNFNRYLQTGRLATGTTLSIVLTWRVLELSPQSAIAQLERFYPKNETGDAESEGCDEKRSESKNHEV